MRAQISAASHPQNRKNGWRRPVQEPESLSDIMDECNSMSYRTRYPSISLASSLACSLPRSQFGCLPRAHVSVCLEFLPSSHTLPCPSSAPRLVSFGALAACGMLFMGLSVALLPLIVFKVAVCLSVCLLLFVCLCVCLFRFRFRFRFLSGCLFVCLRAFASACLPACLLKRMKRCPGWRGLWG